MIDNIPSYYFREAAYQFQMDVPPPMCYDLHSMIQAAVELVLAGSVKVLPPDEHRDLYDEFWVSTLNGVPTWRYYVCISRHTCECSDLPYGGYCEHLIAAHIRIRGFRLISEVIVSTLPQSRDG